MWQQYTYNGPRSSHPYSVYTPTKYQVGTAVPLVVMLHGCTQTARDFAAGTQMNRLAEEYGFVVVYPQQTRTYNQNLCWNWFASANQYRGSGEPAILAGIVQTMKQEQTSWSIDPHRIYVAGHSAGAAMAVILGATYPDLFAAIGVHSGLEYQAASSLNNSLKAMYQGGPDPVQQGQAAYDAMGGAARVVPTIVFHGTHDQTVSSINGDQVVQQWMHTDQLASQGRYVADFQHPTTSRIKQVPGARSYTVSIWKNGTGREVQVYWKVNGMGHAWSGGSSDGSYTDPHGPNASLAMYHFFMDHPMEGVDRYDVPSRQSLRQFLTDMLNLRRKKRS